MIKLFKTTPTHKYADMVNFYEYNHDEEYGTTSCTAYLKNGEINHGYVTCSYDTVIENIEKYREDSKYRKYIPIEINDEIIEEQNKLCKSVKKKQKRAVKKVRRTYR